MKRILIVLFAICLLFSCNKYESNRKEMEVKIRQDRMDEAFKRNAKCKIFILSVLKYDTTNMNYVESVKRSRILDKVDLLQQTGRMLLEEVSLSRQKLALYEKLGSSELVAIAVNDLKAKIKECQLNSDSVKRLLRSDSIISARMDSRKNSSIVYRAQTYFKATYTQNGKTENVMDTIYCIFDEKLNQLRFK